MKEIVNLIVGMIHTYVTLINQNSKDVTIVTYYKNSEGYITKKDMFILKSNQKLKKYIGLRGHNYLYSIDAIIQTDQGTSETIQLWDY